MSHYLGGFIIQYWWVLQSGSRIIPIWFEMYRKLPLIPVLRAQCPRKRVDLVLEVCISFPYQRFAAMPACSLIFSAIWMYQRWHFNIYRKQTDCRDCTRCVLARYGLYGADFQRPFPENLLLSELLTDTKTRGTKYDHCCWEASSVQLF